jgi:hypothetical protein
MSDNGPDRRHSSPFATGPSTGADLARVLIEGPREVVDTEAVCRVVHSRHETSCTEKRQRNDSQRNDATAKLVSLLSGRRARVELRHPADDRHGAITWSDPPEVRPRRGRRGLAAFGA